MDINMKEVDGVFVKEDMDPYSEYTHHVEAQPQQRTEVKVVSDRGKESRNQMNQMVQNVDEAMEGFDIMMEFGNKMFERLRRL